MTLQEIERTLDTTMRKHAEHWCIMGPDEWEKEWHDGRSVWEQGCVGVIFPPGIERWVPSVDEEGRPYMEHQTSGIDEWYVFENSTVKDMEDGIARLNSEYESYLAEGWTPMWQCDQAREDRQSTPQVKLYTGD